MTGFIIGAALLALLAVLFVVLPLLRSRPAAAPPAATTAMVATLGLIAVSAVIYSLLGNPAGVRATVTPGSGAKANIAALARRLEQHPNDEVTWVALGAAYANTGELGLALRSYRRADQLAHGADANILADMAEAMLLQDNGAHSQQQASELLQRALHLDPQSPKALFYSALIAYRSGDLQVARDDFAALLKLNPAPPENLRVALQRQIDQIDAQLHPQSDPATAIHVRVKLASALESKVPPNASLFVFVRAPDGGPPLAVKRSAMKLPQDIELSSADAMIPSRSVQPGQKVTVVARISTSGNPLPQSGDLYGQIDYVAGKTGPRSLEIDKLTP
jgi:cytochrome c-type biogenesis protein CcmH